MANSLSGSPVAIRRSEFMPEWMSRPRPDGFGSSSRAPERDWQSGVHSGSLKEPELPACE
jgi:hypothetical protein